MMEQCALLPFSQAARSFFAFMEQVYIKSRRHPKETPRLPKDVSYLPKSAKSARRKAIISHKLPPPPPQVMSSF